jgi:2-dehydro-3-deoxyphosphooctonate aldolase (KDO 8-P synthase)
MSDLLSVPKSPVVSDGTIKVGGGLPYLIIAGLCIVEDEATTLRHAEALQSASADLPVTLVFKASFDKANRSSISSFRGPGMAEGLRILQKVKDTLGLPILTDVHETWQCTEAAAVADILQIPAFLCRQTDLLLAAAATGRMLNVKKGQFLAPEDVRPLLSKLKESGCDRVTITERGVSFGYNTLVNDFRALPTIRRLGAPVIFDATHSVQRPGGHGNRSGGDRTMVPFLAKAAAAVGADGFFFEVHENVAVAKSDADNALPLDDFRPLLRKLLEIRAVAES